MKRIRTVAASAGAAGVLAAGIAFFAPEKALALSCGIPDNMPAGCQYQYSHVSCSACGPGFVGVRKVAGPAGCPLSFCADLF